MRVIDHINQAIEKKETIFSYEILPPLRGNSIDMVYKTIDLLKQFDPKYINITTHRSEYQYKEKADGLFEKVAVRKRPGTIAIAAAIKTKYNINVVPHMLCSGFSKEETEYALMDLHYLGIFDLLVLRGDKAKHEAGFIPDENGHAHASELQEQINQWNKGLLLDGSSIKGPIQSQFSYSVAGYPEKHDEAPNLDSDMYWLKKKVENGADYIITQMFFDNSKYFEFVDKCRKNDINVPIIPGIKPITLKNQLSVLPKIFHVDIPETFANELRKCKSNEEAVEVGVEWCIAQSKELKEAGVPNLHYYTMMARNSVERVAKEIF